MDAAPTGQDAFTGPATPTQTPRRPRPLVDPKETEERQCSAIVSWCETELGSDMINLEHPWPEQFVTSQWHIPEKWYRLYRTAAAVLFICLLSADMAYETHEFYDGHTWRWFIFASNWSFLSLAVSIFIHAVTSWLYEYKPFWIMDPVHIHHTTLPIKFQWLLYNISSCSSFVVTCGYWGYVAFYTNSRFIYILMPEGPKRIIVTSNMSRLKHTINSLYVLLDVFICNTPIRLQHLFLTLFVASLYIVFNSLYYTSFGALILETPTQADDGPQRNYYFMNWANPVEAICTCVLGMMLVVLAQVLLHFLFLTRRWLYQAFVYKPGSGPDDSELQNIISRSSTYNTLEEH